MQQQQQQPANYDLLAVFPDETQADTAATRLRREGFNDDEVYQLPAGTAGSGQFREHGPNQARRDLFLQTQRSGPNPLLVVLLAVIFGIVVAAVGFVATFALPTIHEPLSSGVGALVGIIVGALIGLLRRGRVRGAIGQAAASTTAPPAAPQGALTIVALRFADPDNISRKSRARAILLNNQGKIDRSVSRRD